MVPTSFPRGGGTNGALSKRLLEEQIAKLAQAAVRKTQEDHLPDEDIARLLSALQNMGIVSVGKLRAHWLLYEKPYRVFDENIRFACPICFWRLQRLPAFRGLRRSLLKTVASSSDAQVAPLPHSLLLLGTVIAEKSLSRPMYKNAEPSILKALLPP